MRQIRRNLIFTKRFCFKKNFWELSSLQVTSPFYTWLSSCTFFLNFYYLFLKPVMIDKYSARTVVKILLNSMTTQGKKNLSRVVALPIISRKNVMIVKKLLYCGFFRSVVLTWPLFLVTLKLLKKTRNINKKKLINELQ